MTKAITLRGTGKSCKSRIPFALMLMTIMGAGGAAGYFVGKYHYNTTGDYSWYLPASLIGIGAGLAVAVPVSTKATGCRMNWLPK